MLNVFCFCLGPNHAVIQINGGKGIEVGAEEIIHNRLAGGGSIGQAEGHDCKLEVTISGTEGCFMDVLRGHGDLVIC